MSIESSLVYSNSYETVGIIWDNHSVLCMYCIQCSGIRVILNCELLYHIFDTNIV